ncbi:MAG TPA: hypothetical protein VF235_04800 [Actinomycetota bacterium]
MDTTITAATARAVRPSVLQVAAVLLALVLGVAFGSVLARSVSADATPQTATWDAQKLAAYGGRLQFTQSQAPAPAWDQAKLDALEGRLAAG